MNEKRHEKTIVRGSASKLLAVLQVTRAALAFTAVADAWTLLLLKIPDQPAPPHLPEELGLTAAVSFLLYCFGMSLNDLLDTRRDRLFAPWRPLPSGRLSPAAAIVLSLLCLLGALFSAALLAMYQTGFLVPLSLLMAIVAAGLIVFYNAVAKFLGAVGLVTLGLVRAVNSLVARPESHFMLLAMFLFTHITVAGMAAYHMESKRPRLKFHDVCIAAGALLGVNGLMLGWMAYHGLWNNWLLHMAEGPGLVTLVYFGWAVFRYCKPWPNRRTQGQRVILAAMFFLFVYDGSLLLANGQRMATLLIAGCGICSLIAFYALRLAGKGLSIRPQYRVTRESRRVR